MENRFGQDRVAIYELPDGDKINSENYSEFIPVFEYYQSTKHFEKEIEKRFAKGTNPLVLTEGPLDVRYIQHAFNMLGENELLNSLDIEFIGIEEDNGKSRFGGNTWLNNFRNTYETNSTLYHRPILLLYDCDTQKPPEQIEKLLVRSIPKNDENTAYIKGIENLFPMKFFEDEFKFRKEYYNRIHNGEGGFVEKPDKPKFCNWICANGSAEDFEKFKEVVKILKEFVEATQPKP